MKRLFAREKGGPTQIKLHVYEIVNLCEELAVMMSLAGCTILSTPDLCSIAV
jgi:hypothetical protein